jgi:hypothetical protein
MFRLSSTHSSDLPSLAAIRRMAATAASIKSLSPSAG